MQCEDGVTAALKTDPPLETTLLKDVIVAPIDPQFICCSLGNFFLLVREQICNDELIVTTMADNNNRCLFPSESFALSGFPQVPSVTHCCSHLVFH